MTSQSRGEGEKTYCSTCDYCGAEVSPGNLFYDDGPGEFLCRYCMAEAESCGCSDSD